MGTVRYRIAASQFIAVCDCDEPEKNILTLKNMIEDGARVQLDIAGFCYGCGFDLEIISVSDSTTGSLNVFSVDVGAVATYAAAQGITVEMVFTVLNEPTRGEVLRICLANLREAIRVPSDTGFFCYRGVEALLQYYIQHRTAADKSRAWEMLQRQLSIKEETTRLLSEYAKPARHDEFVRISDEERAECFVSAWSVVGQVIKSALPSAPGGTQMRAPIAGESGASPA